MPTETIDAARTLTQFCLAELNAEARAEQTARPKNKAYGLRS